MTNDAVFLLQSIDEASDNTPTSTQKFPLGAIITTSEPFGSTACVKKFMYIQAPVAGLSAYNVYLIDYSGVYGTEVVVATPATSAVYRTYGVTQNDFTTSYYGWIQIEGDCTATSTTDTTLGYTGKCANGVTTVTDEGAVTISASSIGMWKKTGTGSGNRAFYLFGQRATVA